MRISHLSVGLVLALASSGCDSTGLDGDDDPIDGGNGNGTNITLDVNPQQTYLRTSDDDAIDAAAVSLTDLGYAPGDEVCFRSVGNFSLVEGLLASQRGDGFLTAVFSTSSTLLSDSQLNRVSGAVNAGSDVTTQPTDRNGLATDIQEDFRADDVCVTIPRRAEFVFFSPVDTYFQDNGPAPNAPFRVRIENGNDN